jgi:hypothetical protein
MVIVEFLDCDEAAHAAVILRAFGLSATVTGRELTAADEPPFMVWTVAAPELRDTPKPERDEATDYIDTKWDREAEEREYPLHRWRHLD